MKCPDLDDCSYVYIRVFVNTDIQDLKDDVTHINDEIVMIRHNGEGFYGLYTIELN